MAIELATLYLNFLLKWKNQKVSSHELEMTAKVYSEKATFLP